MLQKAKLIQTPKVFIISMTALLIFFSLSANAQQTLDQEADSLRFDPSIRQSINMCPLGMAFGIFSANYEYLLTPHHGLVARVDYEAVPKTYSAANIDPSGMAFILNYRYHLKGAMESCFVGAYSRYRVYKGEGNLEGTKFDFTMPDFTLGLNAGKRWIWDSGFNITFALGYGYSWKSRTADPDLPGVNEAIDVFENGYDFINPFYGEFSIGYAF